MTQLLFNHTTPETAYVVDDYPYGFRLRCKIRYWLEHREGYGFRFMTQTTNPKRGHVWNKAKAGTYHKFGAAMLLNEEGHVTYTGLGEYCNGATAAKWAEEFGEAVPEVGRKTLAQWVAAKVAYDANRNPGDPLRVGLPEARAALLAVK